MAREPYEQRVPGSPAPPELALGSYLPADGMRRPLSSGGQRIPPGAVEAALDRLEETIDEENALLAQRGGRPDLAQISRRKSQSLLELTRLGRALPPGDGAGLRPHILRLRDKLILNQRTLGLHLAAVREITDIMVGALNEAESDGTYGSPRPGRLVRP